MNDNEYDHVLALAIEEARLMIAEFGEKIKQDESTFHIILFDRVLSEVDDSNYSYLEAKDVSEVCTEVESDVIHGDILGL